MKIFEICCKVIMIISTFTILYGLFVISTIKEEETNEDYVLDVQQEGYIIKNSEKHRGIYIPFGELEEFIINDNL